MEKLICSSCGATLTPNATQPFLTCEYCDTTVPNTHYVQGEATASAVNLPELCVSTLIEMGEGQELAKVADGCFGNPIREANTARSAMEIPGNEKVYLVMDRSSIFWSVEEGLALGDSGLYYRHDGESGKRSWDAFINGAIAFDAGSSKQNPGTLTIGTSLSFSIVTEEDASLARFLVDFHNRVYRQYTGEAAPAAWCVTENEAAVEEESSGGVAGILGTVATVAGALLRNNRQRTVMQRSVVQRPVVQRSFRQPAPARPQPRQEMPQPREPQPMHRQRSERPGGMFRTTGGHGGPGGRGGMGGPGGRGPGGPGGRGGRR